MLAQVCTVDNLKDICNFQRFFSCADALKFYESYICIFQIPNWSLDDNSRILEKIWPSKVYI